MTKTEIYREICDDAANLYVAKNGDYGDAYANLRKKYPNLILIHLNEKLSRLEQLMSQGYEAQVDESIDDTLCDIAGYAQMELTERMYDNLKSVPLS